MRSDNLFVRDGSPHGNTGVPETGQATFRDILMPAPGSMNAKTRITVPALISRQTNTYARYKLPVILECDGLPLLFHPVLRNGPGGAVDCIRHGRAACPAFGMAPYGRVAAGDRVVGAVAGEGADAGAVARG